MPLVMVRYDDYSEGSSATVERLLFEVLRRHQATALVAVVPACCSGGQTDPGPQPLLRLSGAKVRMLKDALADGTAVAALHGFSHQTRAGARRPTEFSGMPLHEQADRIGKGLAILSAELGCQVFWFVPPWNDYDMETLRALEAKGIRWLSAGPRFGPGRRAPGWLYAPATTGITALDDALSKGTLTRQRGALVTLLLHDYDFRESGDARAVTDAEHFGEVLRRLVAFPGATLCNPDDLAKDCGRWGYWRYISNRLVSRGPQWVPPLQRHRPERAGIVPTPSAMARVALRYSIACCLYGAVGLLGYLVVMLLGARFSGGGSAVGRSVCLAVAAAPAVLLVVRAIARRQLYLPTAAAIMFFVGAMVGVLSIE